MPYQSFLAGIKPACFENLDRLTADIRNQLEKYPYHQNYENAAIFFQTESLKEQFLEQTEGLSLESPAYHKMLGLTLGFPPKAVEFYAQYYEMQLQDRPAANHYLFTHKVGYRYAGIMCQGHIDDLVENAEWLWNRYNINDEMVIKVIQKPDSELITFPVRFKNIDDLLKAGEEVRHVLEHNKKILNPNVILT